MFIQYLFGLAVVEACRSDAVLGGRGDRVRLKWPNDIYVIRDDQGLKKVGGILVNTSFTGGMVDVIIGLSCTYCQIDVCSFTISYQVVV